MYPGPYAQRFADRPAFIMATSGEVVTYGDLERRSNRLAHLLRVLLPGGGLPALRVAHEIGGRLRLALAGGHEAGRDALEALVACGQRPALR